MQRCERAGGRYLKDRACRRAGIADVCRAINGSSAVEVAVLPEQQWGIRRFSVEAVELMQGRFRPRKESVDKQSRHRWRRLDQ